ALLFRYSVRPQLGRNANRAHGPAQAAAPGWKAPSGSLAQSAGRSFGNPVGPTPVPPPSTVDRLLPAIWLAAAASRTTGLARIDDAGKAEADRYGNPTGARARTARSLSWGPAKAANESRDKTFSGQSACWCKGRSRCW